MNIIESLQRKYLPGFYESRYLSRKTLALSLKEKCSKDPRDITVYQLKIILKVLEQFRLLGKEERLEEQERVMKTKIVENSVYSSLVAMLPFAVREFHRVKSGPKILTVLAIFGSANYLLMRGYFEGYVEECRRVAQRNIGKLNEDSPIPM